MYPLKLSDIPGFTHVLSSYEISSCETESIKCNTVKYINEYYKVINYNKPRLTNFNEIEEYGALRSVIVNPLNKVIGFSPPKSIPYWDFISKYPSFLLGDHVEEEEKVSANAAKQVICQEFVEGTMINVFWDSCISQFVVSTKNTVGADSSFFVTNPRKTFREMFEESASYVGLSINNLNNEYCYSFVMQHPENRIVTYYEVPALHLIAVYKIIHDFDETSPSVSIVTVESVDFNIARGCDALRESGVQYLKTYDEIASYQEAVDKFASVTTPYNIQGVVLVNLETGERTKARNPNFEQVKRLRGNQPKGQYQYLSLMSQGKIREFLSFYPEFSDDFLLYKDQLHKFTSQLLTHYSDCYIKKQAPLMSFPKQYRTHMYNLNTLYKSVLKPAGQFVNKLVTINYVNGLPTDHLMYAINYDMRTDV
jgi:hypothetical protein